MMANILRYALFWGVLAGWLWLAPLALSAQHVVEATVLTPEDDAEEADPQSQATGTVFLYNADLELVEDPDNDRGNQLVGLRFAQVAIPAGAQVVRAYLQFTCDEIDALPGDKVIRMQNAANPPTFAFLPFNLSLRPTLPDSVVWQNLPLWNRAGDDGPAQRSPNLAALVQQIVARPDWQSGQAMVFLLSGAGKRIADAYDGDPQAAPRLVVEYLDETYPVGDFPIARSSVWKYQTGANLPAPDWMSASFDDSNWAFGLGSLGYGQGDEQTVLDFGPDPAQKYRAAYFRHLFRVDDPAVADSLVLRCRYDDGLVVYLNGVELLRDNLPSGPLDGQTLALQPTNGAQETEYREFRLPATLLQGDNVLAAAVHLHSPSDDDLTFDLEVYPARNPLGSTELPIAQGSPWAYRDSVVNLDGSDWTLPSYDDRDWAYGPAPLGYGHSQVATELSFGNNPNAKPITAYFRREVYVPDFDLMPDSLILSLRRDDGAVVYVNGQEVFRSNMPISPINAETPALTPVTGADEDRYFVRRIAQGYFQEGLNVIAVEVHLHAATDPDLLFDLGVENFFTSLPPAADFTANRTTVEVNQEVQFGDASAPRADTLIWRFPGGMVVDPNPDSPRVRYAEVGLYDVELIAGNDNGFDTLLRRSYILVEPATNLATALPGGHLRLYPNPVRDRLTLELTLNQSQAVSAELWTLDGRRLTRWTPRRLGPGLHQWLLDLPPYHGRLLLRVQTGQAQVSRVIWVK